MKKRSLLIGAIISFAALALAGCGSKMPEGYYTLNEITEGDVTVKEKDLDDYGLDESYIVFEEEGDGYLVLLDTPSDFTYDKKHGTIDTPFGEVSIKSDSKTVTLSDSQVTMVFKKSKKDAPEKPDAPFAEGAYQGGGEDIDWDDAMGIDRDALHEFWNDNWFGWWEIDGNINEWDAYEDVKYPVLGWSTLDEDGNGEIYLWDNDGTLADVYCSNNGFGLTEYGTMLSESGEFYDKELEHADWNIDPGVYDHDNYICIDGTYRNEEGELEFYYTIHLVKWGQEWSDFDEDELPDEYDWYLEMIENGEEMPEELPE